MAIKNSCLSAGAAMALIIQSACTQEPRPEQITNLLSPLVPLGYVCTSTPSGAYDSGYVYRIDPSGQHWFVSDLSDSVEPKTDPIAIPSYEAAVSISGSLVLELLQPISSIGEASGATGSQVSSNSVLQLKNARVNYLSDDQEILLRQQVSKRIAEYLDIDSSTSLNGSTSLSTPSVDQQYYLVRDVISATGLHIEISRKNQAELGGNVTIQNLVRLDPALKWSDDGVLSLTGDFGEALNICIRAVKLRRGSGILPGDDRFSIAGRGDYLSAEEVVPLITNPPVN